MARSSSGTKRAASAHLEQQDGKRPKLLSTELRPLRSNAGLRARLRAEEEEEATSNTAANQKQSPFLQLPGELRNKIYKLTIRGNIVRPRTVPKTDVTTPRLTRFAVDPDAAITIQSMVLSCRTIQAETEYLLYSENLFIYSFCRSYWSQNAGGFDDDDWVVILDDNKCAAIRTVYASPRYHIDTVADPALDRFSNLEMIILSGWKSWDFDKTSEKALREYSQRRNCQLVVDEC